MYYNAESKRKIYTILLAIQELHVYHNNAYYQQMPFYFTRSRPTSMSKFGLLVCKNGSCEGKKNFTSKDSRSNLKILKLAKIGWVTEWYTICFVAAAVPCHGVFPFPLCTRLAVCLLLGQQAWLRALLF